MIEPSHGPQQVAEDVTVFRASRGRVRLLRVVATIVAAVAIFIASIPIVARPAAPPPMTSIVLVLVLALAMALTSAWLFLLATRVAGMRMEVTDEGLHLVASLFEWHLWNPWAVRDVQLRWDEVQGIRRWPFANQLAPGGVQENVVVYTARGIFGLSNIVWPNPGEMAEAIAAHTGLTVAQTVGELAPRVAPVAAPSRKAKVGVHLVHGLGWLATVMAWLMVGLTVLLLVGGGGTDALIAFVIATAILMAGGSTLRRFRLQ